MSVPEQIYQAALNNGFTKEAACALLAQIQHESAFRANNLEDTRNRSLGLSDEEYVRRVDNGTYTNFVNDGAGFGLAQWTFYSRKQTFINYFRSRGKSIGDLNTQIDFLFYEMKAFFNGIWQKCRTSHDLRDLTWTLLDKWENPDEKQNNMVKRYASAQEFMNQFSNQNGSKKEVTAMTKDDAVRKVLDLARSELGYHEKASNMNLDDKTANSGSGNYTKYARELDAITNWYNGGKNGYAWCDVFVDWLFYKCFGVTTGMQMICQPQRSAGAGCLYSAQYYKQQGRWHTAAPQPGDQIFFTYSPGEYSHTGIVETVSGGMVTTIEGNTSDQVGRRSYGEGSANIAGYGRPKWELVADSDGSAFPDPTEETPVYTELLRKGSRGESVRVLQEKLIQLGYDVGPDGADGDFGNNTEKAVREFQVDNSLEVDGIVGNESWAKLNSLTEKQTPKEESKSDSKPEVEEDPYAEEPTVPKARLSLPLLKEDTEDSFGPYVKLAQAALVCWGYSIIVHGIFGPEMTAKIKDFQEKKGLIADGEIGPDTWKALLKI